jgi:hypothetical protein
MSKRLGHAAGALALPASIKIEPLPAEIEWICLTTEESIC